jgi:hypothetical protein
MAVKASDFGVAKAGLDVTQLGPPSVPAIGVDYGAGWGASTDVAECVPPYGRFSHEKGADPDAYRNDDDMIHHSARWPGSWPHIESTAWS